MDKITMLGTGHAMTFDCFNTCFVYENENGKMLVDTGGGGQLLSQLRKAGLDMRDVSAIFISHQHTDHIMGLPWIFRTLGGPGSGGTIKVYLHPELMHTAKGILELLLPENMANLGSGVEFITVNTGDTAEILGRQFKFFDLHSPNVTQYGFSMTLGDGKKLVFHGDVPFNEANREEIQGADVLIHEAFNLSSDSHGPGGHMPPMPGGKPPMPMPMPGGKLPGGRGPGHSTVKEAAGYAQSLSVKTLILVHGSDGDLKNRKAAYIAEASEVFGGTVYAPDDLDIITLL